PSIRIPDLGPCPASRTFWSEQIRLPRQWQPPERESVPEFFVSFQNPLKLPVGPPQSPNSPKYLWKRPSNQEQSARANWNSDRRRRNHGADRKRVTRRCPRPFAARRSLDHVRSGPRHPVWSGRNSADSPE